jgi:esterase/lipase superfamily enzyme
MDRHFLAVLFVAGSLALGCNSSESDSQAARPEASSAASAGPSADASAGPTLAETHRPIIVGSEPIDPRQPLDSMSPFPSTFGSPPPLDESFAAPAETSPLAETPTEKALNPLRLDFAPAPAAAEADRANPLRRVRSAPRMAAPPELPAAGAEPSPPAPTAFVPSGGAAPSVAAEESLQPGAPAPDARPKSIPLAAEPPAQALAMDLANLGGDAPLAAAAIPQSGPYDVVQIFYGTDRLAAELLVDTLPGRIVRYLPAACSVLVTLCLAVIAASRSGLGMWLLACGAFGISLGLGFQATTRTVDAVRQSGQEGVRYTAERSVGGGVELGLCEVSIPKSHVVGELESPSIFRLEIREDAARHVVLSKTERLASEPFYALLRERVQASPRRELFVFVHGFNVTFEDAARRTAQIHHDLKFLGAPVLFSWPAHDKFVVTYPADENNVAWSAPHLKQFLLEVVKESQAESVNLVAHSMGNRALAAALREIELELKDDSRLFNQVILAAPDIDADDFRHNIAPAMQRTAKRMTLYASSRDDALLASRLLHRGPRAGDAGEGLVVLNGIDTIDVTAIDSSPWGHSYYGSSDPVLNDLKAMLMLAIPPSERTWLSPAERDGLTYWIFQPARTAAAESMLPR